MKKEMIEESKEGVIRVFIEHLGADDIEIEMFSKLIDKNPEDWTCGLDELAHSFLFDIRWLGDVEMAMYEYIKFTEE